MTATGAISANQQDDPLRYAFVEMLFALAVSQVAVHAADLSGASGSWSERLSALTHLALGLTVVAASWVGWRQSRSPGMSQQISSLFSLRFVALLLDVLLVILYFILIRAVELQQKDGVSTTSLPSATPEAMWLSAVFAVYVLWDLIADLFTTGCLPPGLSGGTRFSKAVRVAFVCTSASLLCTALCLAVWWLSLGVSDGYRVALLDISLMVVVLFFRVAKAIETPLASLAQVVDCRAFAHPRAVAGNERVLAAFLMLSYVLSAAVSVGLGRLIPG